MGFNKIYKSLQELFPQIDSRVLRAVAIEHKDPDAAVEAVLEEIIPFFSERSRPSSPLAATSPAGTSAEVQEISDDEVESQQCPLVVHTPDWIPEVQARHDDEVESQQCPEAGDTSYLNSEVPARCDDGLESQNFTDSVLADSFYDASDDDHVPQSETFDSVPEHVQESHTEVCADVPSHLDPFLLVGTMPTKIYKVSEAEETISVGKFTENYPPTLPGNDELENHHSMNNKQESEDSSNSTVDDFVVGTSENSGNDNNIPCMDQAETRGSFQENIEASLSSDDASMISTTREFVGADDSDPSEVVGTSDGSTIDASLSRSSQMHIVDVIDVSIAAAKDNKKILFSAMDSVINLMRELEKKEQTAELAKKEAALGGAVAQNKIEELQKMLQHAKAANDMHAGEVYGEKAILTTELRELQSRVLSLADEKDKSLAVLDEMRQSLQVRLAAAEDKIKEAKLERLEKEKHALDELAKQQSIMEEVVQQSNILRHQSVENAKLQDLLLDRGHVLDVMQGELAVIYQDLRLLKENFDANVPFSKSVSSRQTSCKLASSSSSLQSTVSEPESERCPQTHPTDLVDDITDLVSDVPVEEQTSPRLEIHVDDFSSSTDQNNKVPNDSHKALLDDGWDVLDHEFESESA